LEADGPRLVVDAGGVGYEVLVPESVLLECPPVGAPIDLLVRQVFREDGSALYGFLSPIDRRLFDLLIQVQGCGPKIGLSLIGTLGGGGVLEAISSGDVKGLTRASGVGPRLGERLVVELREKVAAESLVARAVRPTAAVVAEADDLVDALLALGYRKGEAEQAAADARGSHVGLEEQLREALRRLRR
jgi:Holliday junction DNA helicase RuvA